MAEALEEAHGLYVISATPYFDDGAVDYASLERLLEFFVESGAQGVTLLGILGEAAKLSVAESRSVVECAVRRIAGRIPIIVGASSPGTANLCAFAHDMMGLGAAGVMISPLAGLRTEEQIIGYFDQIFASLGDDVPVVLQDYPQNSGVFMSPSLIRKLFQQRKSFKILKHEEAAGLGKISRLRSDEKEAGIRRISILVGNNALYLPQEMKRGADGANTGLAFPEMLVEVIRRFSAGDAEGAENLYDLFLPIIRHEQQPGIGLSIRKEILRRRGLISSARVREPGRVLTSLDHAELEELLKRLQRKVLEAGEKPIQGLDG